MIMLGILHEDTRKDGRERFANYQQKFIGSVSRDFRPIFPDSNPSGALTNSLKQFCSRFIRDFRSQGSKILTPRWAGHSRIKILPNCLLKSNQKPAAKIPIMISRCALWLCDAIHTGEFLKNSDHDFAVCTLTLRCHTHRGVS